MFDNRHFDNSRQSWFIGDNENGRDQIKSTVANFYELLCKLIYTSEEIR